MKSLYLVRHAKSSWKDYTLDDFDRPLNARGKKAAPFMGMQLFLRNENVDALVSSPAKRAISTARMFSKAMDFDGSIIEDHGIYHASEGKLLSLINKFDDTLNRVAMFGHNPGFTDLLYTLTNADIYNMPTAAVARIDFEFDSWQLISAQTGRLIWFDYPKRHPELGGSTE